ncbi:MAG: hypothetical protein IRY94_11155 [Rhodospirillaceae bacterium]|nr:hypothetical protein [Rhodospirillaceae bacterium]
MRRPRLSGSGRRRGTGRLLWGLFGAALAATVVAQAATPIHAWFGIEGTFAFNAWYGFASCVGLVVVAKLLGIVIMRRDDYYDGDGS